MKTQIKRYVQERTRTSQEQKIKNKDTITQQVRHAFKEEDELDHQD